MPIENIFVSSPVDGIEGYRKELRKGLNGLAGMQHIPNEDHVYFYMYEQHFNADLRDQEKSYSEMIIEDFNRSSRGIPCTIFLLFFSNRIGNGTREEFEVFRRHFKEENPDIALWWWKIPSDEPDEEGVEDFLQDLFENYNESLSLGGFHEVRDSSEFCQFILCHLNRHMARRRADQRANG